MATVYVSADTAAKLIGRSKRRINQLVADGELSAIRIGTSNAIDRASIDKYVSKRRVLCAGCDGEVTSADVSNGACTQCGHGLKG